MKKFLSIILLGCIILSFVACGSQTEENSKNNTELNKPETELADNTSSIDMNKFDVVYDFNAISDDFWKGYEYGYKDTDLTNWDVYLGRKEHNLYKTYGKLTPPLSEYTHYFEVNDKYYKLSFGKGDWLYIDSYSPIADDERVTFYALYDRCAQRGGNRDVCDAHCNRWACMVVECSSWVAYVALPHSYTGAQ